MCAPTVCEFICVCSYVFICVHMCISHVVSPRDCFLGAFQLPLTLTIFLPPLSELPEPWRERFDADTSFRTECSKVWHSLPFVQSWVSICSHLQQEEASLIVGKTSIYNYNNMPLDIILLLCSFSRTIVFDFPLGLWSIGLMFFAIQAV